MASFALYQLFADIPLCQILAEPYSSLVSKWQNSNLLSLTSFGCTSECFRITSLFFIFEIFTGALSTKILEREENRRDGFVDMLLNKAKSDAHTSASAEKVEDMDVLENPSPEKHKSMTESSGALLREFVICLSNV